MSAGILNRIKDNVPQSLHKDLYHTLFESHLTYGITVWGGVSNTKLDPLFKAQKKCIRIMFGDKEAYLDKFKTCARARPYENQILGSEFYIKEHTKPLFNSNNLMNVYNLYFYHCSTDIFKILKFRSPISLSSLFTISSRLGKDTLLLTQSPSDSYVYRVGVMWNFVRQELSINEFSTKFSHMKSAIRSYIYKAQKEGDPEQWEESLNNLNLCKPH